MDVPFSFELDSTTLYGLVANPKSVTVANSDDNLITPPSPFPVTPILLTHVAVTSGDATTTAPVSVGYWDDNGDTFTVVWSTAGTEVSGGGIVEDLGEGVPIALNDTRVLTVRYDAADGAADIKGNLTIVIPSGTAAQMQDYIADGIVGNVLDEEGGFVTDEDADNIENE